MNLLLVIYPLIRMKRGVLLAVLCLRLILESEEIGGTD